MNSLRTKAKQAIVSRLGLSTVVNDRIEEQRVKHKREYDRLLERNERRFKKLQGVVADQKQRIKTLERRLESTSRQTRQVAQLFNASSRILDTWTRHYHPRIAIVVTFFGPAPFWLPAFLLSCRQNPDVTWLIYTDTPVDVPLPANVVFKPLSLHALGNRASQVLGTKISISRHRMICDLKPVYGLMFADDLEPFDFWAYSDLDIVWGDIRKFVTNAVLAENDIVSSRGKKLSGHFTLVRNTVQTNHLFELIPGVEQKMADVRYLRLDEHELTCCLKKHISTAPSYACLRVYWPRELTVKAATQREISANASASLWWRDGTTLDAEGREVMYLHFHKLKQTMNEINFSFDHQPDAFKINSAGIWA